MVQSNEDVDLDAILGTESEAPATDGASTETAETHIEEASQRAQERIRELLEENASLKQIKETPPVKDVTIDSFVNSIEDEPSRNLLRTFGELIKKDMESKFSPVISEYQTQKFEKDFAAYDSIPEIAAYKDDLKKSFNRDPSVSLKSLVGEKLLDIQTSKVASVEGRTVAPRDTQPNLADASTEDLYKLLDSMKK